MSVWSERIEELIAEVESLRARLAEAEARKDAAINALSELYDGDACDCSAGPDEPHTAECFQSRVEALLYAPAEPEDVFADVMRRHPELNPEVERQAGLVVRLTEALRAYSPKFGCLCDWDENGNPIGEHSPRCFTYPSEVAAVLAEVEETP